MFLATPVSACPALAALSRPGLSLSARYIAVPEHGRDLWDGGGPDGGDTMLPRIGTNSSSSSI
jgi:hypothetical protein